MQAMTRTFLNTKAAFYTFTVVDNRQTAVGIFVVILVIWGLVEVLNRTTSGKK